MKAKFTLTQSFFLITLTVYIMLLIMPTLRPAMFLDGVVYAAIAKNMALGIGSIWDPQASKTLFPHFYEHPPLAIYMQSLFFKIFGQSYLVERFYDLFIFVISLGAALLILDWSPKKKALGITYFLFLWALIPLNYLIVKNNMLECTLNCMTLISSFFLLSGSLLENNLSTKLIKLIAAAMFMILGFFVNGPTAFFPLSIPLLNALITNRISFKRAFLETISLAVLIVFPILIFFHFSPTAKNSILLYFNTQLFASITGQRDLHYTGFGHLHIILFFIRNTALATLFAGALCLLAYFIPKKKSVTELLKEISQNKKAWLYFYISLAASLPVIISHRQAFHYIAQSSPFYALFLSTLTYPMLKRIYSSVSGPLSDKTKTVIAAFSLLLVIMSLSMVAFFSGVPRKDAAMLEDITKLVNFFPEKETVMTTPTVYTQWSPSIYFARYGSISLTRDGDEKYYLTLKSEVPPKNHHYHQVNKDLKYFNLWERG